MRKPYNHKLSGEKERCALCGCLIHHKKNAYAKPTREGRSHASEHHLVAERFFGRSGNRRGIQREKIFEKCPWGYEDKTATLCYECHEELLQNPVLLPDDIKKLSEIVKIKRLSEKNKPCSKKKIAGRIKLFQKVIKRGLEQVWKENIPK